MENKGITLIALVVTIIVLLILAGISINMLTGQNGILIRASEAKNKTGIAQIDEKVNISVADALTDGLGTITEDGLTKALDNNFGNGNYTLSKTGTDEWTIAVEDRKYRVNGSGSVIIGEAPKYSEDVDEKDIIRDLFLYEVSDENAKTAKIIGMNPKYCNNYDSSCIDYEWGYDSENNRIQIPMQYPDTNYDIKYYTDENRENITTISDTLVVPYNCEIDGKTYTINEADIIVYAYNFSKWYSGLPKVKTIIFPNTITEGIWLGNLSYKYPNNTLQRVVFPEAECKFGNACNCTELKEINMENVTSIGWDAFSKCTGLKSITITQKTTKVESNAFYGWTEDQTINVPFKEGEKPSGWSDGWKYGCKAKINYRK